MGQKYKKDIAEMLSKISDEKALRRIYWFVQVIWQNK